MTIRSATTLKTYFNSGDVPTETQFSDFIDSVYRDGGWYNVKTYGAVGDGTTDDTAAFLAAVAAMPVSTTTIDPVTGTISGGTLFIPAGRYKITAEINLPRGARVEGVTQECSQIISSQTTGSVFQYNDVGSGVQDKLSFCHFSIWQDLTLTPTGGAAIDLLAGTAENDSMSLEVNNVLISGTFVGIRATALIASTIKNTLVKGCVDDGIYIQTKFATGEDHTAITSTLFDSTYTFSNGGNGIRVGDARYIALVACASDSNGGYGYKFESVSTEAVVATPAVSCSMVSCGAERNAAGQGYFRAINGMSIQLRSIAPADLDNPGDLNPVYNTHGITLEDCDGVVIRSCRIDGKTNGTTGYYAIYVTGTSARVLLEDVKYGDDYLDETTNGTNVLDITGTKGLIGRDGHYALGSSLVGTDALLELGGTTAVGDVLTQFAQKSNMVFRTPGAITHFAESYVKASTSTGTFPVLFGRITDNGATAGTVTRLCGDYIREQAEGTNNANHYIGPLSPGAVDFTGDWNLYYPSERNNFLGGPIRWSHPTTGPLDTFGTGSPEAAVTAPVGSIYRRTDGGANTTLYVKESGTGNTGWVAK